MTVSVVDFIFLLIIIVFGALALFALATSMVQANVLNQDLATIGEQYNQLQERLEEKRQEVQEIELETTLLEEERRALESQEACMIKVEENYKKKNAPPEGESED